MRIQGLRSRGAVFAALIGLSCGGCGERSAAEAQPASAHQSSSITGYRNLKLGASFEDTMASAGASRFDALSLSKCIADLPTKGCLLIGADGMQDIHEGVPYRLELSFNRLGTLTDVRLGYAPSGAISSAECQSIHERTLDWAAGEFGGFGYEPQQLSEERVRKTAGGVSYDLSKTGQNFIATLLPNDPIGGRRHLSSMSHFLVIAGQGNCSIGVTLSEPRTIERPILNDLQ